MKTPCADLTIGVSSSPYVNEFTANEAMFDPKNKTDEMRATPTESTKKDRLNRVRKPENRCNTTAQVAMTKNGLASPRDDQATSAEQIAPAIT